MDVRVWAAISRAHLDQMRIYDAFQANVAYAALAPHMDPKKGSVTPDKFRLLK